MWGTGEPGRETGRGTVESRTKVRMRSLSLSCAASSQMLRQSPTPGSEVTGLRLRRLRRKISLQTGIPFRASDCLRFAPQPAGQGRLSWCRF